MCRFMTYPTPETLPFSPIWVHPSARPRGFPKTQPLDRRNPTLAELTQAVGQEAEKCPEARVVDDASRRRGVDRAGLRTDHRKSRAPVYNNRRDARRQWAENLPVISYSSLNISGRRLMALEPLSIGGAPWSESKNEVLGMVLTDRATICQKVSENDAVPERTRARAAGFVTEFNRLVPARGKGTAGQHFHGQDLINYNRAIHAGSTRCRSRACNRAESVIVHMR